jgi:GTP cyclohydrolase I
MGENVERDGLLKTPSRSAKALLHFTSGYNLEVKDAVGDALFDIESPDEVQTDGSSSSSSSSSSCKPQGEDTDDTSGMVLVRNIEVR